MPQKEIASHRKALTVRLDAELYAALMDAGKMRGLGTTNEIMEAAVLEFISGSAQDGNLIDQLRRKQQELQKVVEARQPQPA